MGDKLIKIILSIFGILIVIALVVFVACYEASMNKQIKYYDEKIEELNRKLNEKEQEDMEPEEDETSEEVEIKKETYYEVKQAPAVSVPAYTPEPEQAPEVEYVPDGYYETRQTAYQAALPYMNGELNCITGFDEYVSNYGKTYYAAILQYCEPPVFGTGEAEEPENPGNEENG